jgi:hypothetical protein
MRIACASPLAVVLGGSEDTLELTLFSYSPLNG